MTMYPAMPLDILQFALAVCLGNFRRSRYMVLQRALCRMSEDTNYDDKMRNTYQVLRAACKQYSPWKE